MSYLDSKYLNMLSPHLRNFKRKSNNLWEFSCPFCGDSKKDSRKARGYVFSTPKGLRYYCHNCSVSTVISKLIKHVSPSIYEEYTKELLLEKYGPDPDQFEEMTEKYKEKVSEEVIDERFASLQRITDLDPKHPARKFLSDRKISMLWQERLFFTPNFCKFTNSLIPEKFSEKAVERGEPRIIIPLISKDKKMFGYQGRALDNSPQKYYTIILDSSQPKIFGLDRVDLDRKFYVVEGPFDAMFLHNAIAICGSDLWAFRHQNAVYVFDNEPRSNDTLRKMQKAINLDLPIVIWPSSFREKDINEMVLADLPIDHIKKVMEDNTCKSLEAQLNFNEWRCRK